MPDTCELAMLVESSRLKGLLAWSLLMPVRQRAVDAQWQFTQQTYGLHRPSRNGILQIFRAVNFYIGPGNPAILSVPVSIQDSSDFVLNLIEHGPKHIENCGYQELWSLSNSSPLTLQELRAAIGL